MFNIFGKKDTDTEKVRATYSPWNVGVGTVFEIDNLELKIHKDKLNFDIDVGTLTVTDVRRYDRSSDQEVFVFDTDKNIQVWAHFDLDGKLLFAAISRKALEDAPEDFGEYLDKPQGHLGLRTIEMDDLTYNRSGSSDEEWEDYKHDQDQSLLNPKPKENYYQYFERNVSDTDFVEWLLLSVCDTGDEHWAQIEIGVFLSEFDLKQFN